MHVLLMCLRSVCVYPVVSSKPSSAYILVFIILFKYLIRTVTHTHTFSLTSERRYLHIFARRLIKCCLLKPTKLTKHIYLNLISLYKIIIIYELECGRHYGWNVIKKSLIILLIESSNTNYIQKVWSEKSRTSLRRILVRERARSRLINDNSTTASK